MNPLFNEENLRALAESDPDDFKDLIRSYLEQVTRQTTELEMRFRLENWEEARLIAHSAAGSSGVIGVRVLAHHV